MAKHGVKKAYAIPQKGDESGVARRSGRPTADQGDEYSQRGNFTVLMSEAMVKRVDIFAQYATLKRMTRIERPEAIRNLLQFALNAYQKQVKKVDTQTDLFGPTAVFDCFELPKKPSGGEVL